jgi:hypothetical protein
LQKANESLNKLSKETKLEIRWLKVQRAFLVAGIGYLAVNR